MTYRSAISAFHDSIENIRVGNRLRVSALMLGMFNKEASTIKVSIYLGCRKCFSFSNKSSRKWLAIRQIIYVKGLNVVIIVVCLKGIRDHKFESELFGKTFICLRICYSPFDKDLLERQKATPQSEVLQFLRWQQTLCMQGNWLLSWKTQCLGVWGKPIFCQPY